MFKRKQSPPARQRATADAESGNPSFTYSSARQPSPEPTTPKENLWHFWAQRIGLLIFLVVATAALVNILSLAPAAKVLPLASNGSQAFLRPESTYEAAVNQILNSSIWNRTKVTIDASSISDQLLRQFPELNSASVTVPLFNHRPLVYVQAAQPALVLNASNGSYIVATSGRALIRLDSNTKVAPKIPAVTDQSGLKVQLNHQALPTASVTFIQVVLAELAAKQYTASSLTLPPESNELDVRLNNQPYLVKFNLASSDPRGEAGTFLAAISSLKKQNINPSQYVDVRVDGRAYYQ